MSPAAQEGAGGHHSRTNIYVGLWRLTQFASEQGQNRFQAEWASTTIHGFIPKWVLLYPQLQPRACPWVLPV